jgi:hypothetical protein
MGNHQVGARWCAFMKGQFTVEPLTWAQPGLPDRVSGAVRVGHRIIRCKQKETPMAATTGAERNVNL